MTNRWNDVVKPSEEDAEFEKLRNREFDAREKLKDTARNKIAAFVKEYLHTAGIPYHDERNWFADSYDHPLPPILVDGNWEKGFEDDAGIYFRGQISFYPDIHAPVEDPLNFSTGWNIQYRRAFPPQPPEEERHWSKPKGILEERLEKVLGELKEHLFPSYPDCPPEYQFVFRLHQMEQDIKNNSLRTYHEASEDAYRLIVINESIPTTRQFIPRNQKWKKLAEVLGPLDVEIYKLFHDRNR